ncbi:MAG: hypothetical protein V8S69_05530 [Dakarella massiliensis]
MTGILRGFAFIAHFRGLDMGPEEIREILNYDSSKPEEAGHIHELLHRQIRGGGCQNPGADRTSDKALRVEHSCHGHTHGHQCGIIQELSAPEAGGNRTRDPLNSHTANLLIGH